MKKVQTETITLLVERVLDITANEEDVLEVTMSGVTIEDIFSEITPRDMLAAMDRNEIKEFLEDTEE